MFQRMAEISAAQCLADLFKVPGTRGHALHKERAGQYGVDLDRPFSLILKPDGVPGQYTKNGDVDTSLVTQVKIWEVTNYH